MKRSTSFLVFAPTVVVMTAIDRLSKAWAADALSMGEVGYDLGPVDLTLVHNSGAAFGVGEDSTALFAGLACVIIAVIVVWLACFKRHGAFEVIGLSLIAAGGVGNLVDRVTLGYVVDFIEFTFVEFPVFNVADMCVTVGVVLFVISVIAMDFGGDGSESEGDAASGEGAVDGDGAGEAAEGDPVSFCGAEYVSPVETGDEGEGAAR